MSVELQALKTNTGFMPYEPQDLEEFEKMPYGKPIKLVCTVARSSPQNRWFHACLQTLFKQQDTWPTFTLFRNAVKRALGLCEVYEVKGKEFFEYPSIAFDKMPQDEFNVLVERFVDLVCTRIIPQMDDESARRMLNLLDADNGAIGSRQVA
mgnify:FL=1|tara:strand:+ start:353 stop:808 length:456 start_codon:yes stop_codon:yes gene_type:complete